MATDIGNMSLQGAVDLSGLVKKNTQPSPAQTGDQPSPSAAVVRDITEAQMADMVELSQSVPVILEFYGQGHQPALGPIVESFSGRLVLATVDVAAAPELVQGLGITGIPTVFAVIQGRPAPLFQGMPPEDDVRTLFAEVLQVASQAGVTGRVEIDEPGSDELSEEPVEAPWVAAAKDSLARNDFDAARQAFEAGLATDPKNADAQAGLARVELLRRIHESSKDQDAIRRQAADHPTDLDAQFLVADVDVSGGHLEDAFARLLALFGAGEPDDKTIIRERLIELFDAGGPGHPAVVAARQRLASLLY